MDFRRLFCLMCTCSSVFAIDSCCSHISLFHFLRFSLAFLSLLVAVSSESSSASSSSSAAPVAFWSFNHTNFLTLCVRERVMMYVEARVIPPPSASSSSSSSSASSSPSSSNEAETEHGQQLLALIALMLSAYMEKGWNIFKPKGA